MNKIKIILYRFLGFKKYLSLISSIYIWLIAKGKLKSQYPEIFFLKDIIKEGFSCIDIGANLGYYSVFLSKYSGKTGKVYAVEPVTVFGEIWRRNVKKSKIDNLTLFPYALGSEEKKIQMGTPKITDTLHHGMTKIIGQNEECEKKFDAIMKIPDELFGNIDHIDFIKIDVEGYESVVLENMKQTLSMHHPMIQGEMGGAENKKKCVEILTDLGYKTFKLNNGRLVEIPKEETLSVKEDIYFK